MERVEKAASVEISEQQQLLRQDHHYQTTGSKSEEQELEFIPQWKDKISIRGLAVTAFYLVALFWIIIQVNAAGLLGFFFVLSWTGLLSNGISLLAVLTSYYGSSSAVAAIGASFPASTSKDAPPPLRASASQSFDEYYPPYSPSHSEDSRETREEEGIPDLEDDEEGGGEEDCQQEVVKEVHGNCSSGGGGGGGKVSHSKEGPRDKSEAEYETHMESDAVENEDEVHMLTVEKAASVEISEQPLLQQDHHYQTTTHSTMESDEEELEFIPQWKDKISIRSLAVTAFYLVALFCIITQVKLNLTAAGLLGFFFLTSWTGLLSNGISLLAVLTSYYGSSLTTATTGAIGASSSASTSEEPPPLLRASASLFLNSFDKYYLPCTPSKDSREVREEYGIPDLEDEEEEDDYQQEVVKEVHGNHKLVYCSSSMEDEEEGPRNKSEALFRVMESDEEAEYDLHMMDKKMVGDEDRSSGDAAGFNTIDGELNLR